MASIEGSKLFLGQVDKIQQRLNDAVKSANDIGREKLNIDLTLFDRGLEAVTDPETGQSLIRAVPPERNQLLKAQIANKRALEIADQNLANTLRQTQIGADIETALRPETEILRGLKRGVKAEERQISREETVKDVETQIEAEVAVRESDSGKKLSKLQREEVADKIKGEAKAKAEAAVTPEAVEARRQIELSRVLTQTSPEAIKARQVLFNERMNEKALAFEQDLRLNQRASEQDIAFKLEQFRAAQKEILTFTNTTDVVQASKIFEAVFGVPPGTLNPISTEEQIRALGDVGEARITEKAVQAGQIAVQLEGSIEQAFEGIDFDFNDLTDERDLNEIIGDPRLGRGQETITAKTLNKLIQSISTGSGFSDKQVASAMLAKLSVGIDVAINDVEAGDIAKFSGAEKRVAKKLRFLRDTLKEVAKSGIK